MQMRKTSGGGTQVHGVRGSLAVLLVSAFVVFSPQAVAADAVEVEVLESTDSRILIEFLVQDYWLEPVMIDDQEFTRVVVDDEGSMKLAGAPELPTINRSIVIPDDAQMELRVLDYEYHEITDIDIAPSRGILSRQVNPEDVPHMFGSQYSLDEFFPAKIASLRAPYILRDLRGQVVDITPVQYNPATRTLRIYDRIEVEIVATGPGLENVLHRTVGRDSLVFSKMYDSVFINYIPDSKYSSLNETGEMLIICHDAWLSNINPLVAHKNSVGIATTAVGVSTIGNSTSAITSYIQSTFDSSNLAFVLLVGDSTQVVTPSVSGGASDPSYSKVAGSDDYPDILIGRFSAETSAHVDTQVQRTIEYETMPATTQDWFKKGIGIGSDEGPGDDNEDDWEHIDNIRDDLLACGYTTVDQIYDPGASSSAVSAALNTGRGIINYCGHGSTTSWATTGFSSSHVSSLTNDGMLPFIFSVACVNGNFNGSTCFAEAWLRATNGANPTGAIGMYASSINQSWSPPMAAQDESVDLLVADQYFSFGGLAFAGSCQMIDEYGGGGVDMFNTWHVFGDPSVRVYGVATPPSGLSVDPMSEVESLGQAGGPFVPEQFVYTLTNHGDISFDFEVSADVDWLDIDADSGSLSGGSTTDVTVSINSDAMSMGNGNYVATLEFTNVTDGDGDTTRTAVLVIGVPEPQHEWPLDEDPGWTTDGAWEFGVPLGSGGEHGSPDPGSGYTGTNVYGYNLSGDYPANLPENHLTTGPIDCSELTQVGLKFWRWLGVESNVYDHAYVKVSTDGTTWETVWENGGEVADGSWGQQEFDLSAIADGQSEVYLRWTMGTTDGGYHYCGWNIDDIELWGVGAEDCSDKDNDGFLPPYCGGDDCDDNDYDINPDADEDCDDGIDNDCDELIDDDDPDCDDDDEDGVAFNKTDPSGCGCNTPGLNEVGPEGLLSILLI